MKKVTFFQQWGTFMLALPLLTTSCLQDPDNNPIPQTEIQTISDPELLNQRVNNMTVLVPVISTVTGRVDDTYNLVQVSEVAAPMVEGVRVAASCLDYSGNVVAVSYNTAGEVFQGAVDVLKRSGESLSFLSSITLNNSDVSMVTFESNDLYWVGGSPSSDSVAFMDRITLKQDEPVLDTYERVRLGGHMATGLQKAGDELYITTGDVVENGGGLYLLNRKDLSLTSYQAVHDARWAVFTDNSIYVLGATPGHMQVYKRGTLEPLVDYDVAGLHYAGTKATFDSYSNHLYVASAYEGVKIYNAATGELKASVPLPTDQYSPEMMAISVTMDGNKGFMACGEAVFMFKVSNAGTKPEAFLVGRLDLGNYQSINYVRYRDGYLLVAAGLGGTKLIKVSD